MIEPYKLPNKIYFTGAPGSGWSGVAQQIERLHGFNLSDRNPDREYISGLYSGHKGSYFGKGMEFEANSSDVEQAWEEPEGGCKLVKSHEWATDLKGIDLYHCKPDNDWIMLVLRSDLACQSWWFNAGGFGITYPKYAAYGDPANMLYQIQRQNQSMMKFAFEKDLVWSSFNKRWVDDNFNQHLPTIPEWDDILVTIYKP